MPVCVFDVHCSGETGTEQTRHTIVRIIFAMFFYFVLLSLVGGTSLKRFNNEILIKIFDISVTCAL